MLKRLLLSIPLAAFITAALFLLMHYLVSMPPGRTEVTESHTISLARQIKDTESRPKDRLIKPPEVKEPTSLAPRPDHDSVFKDANVNTKIKHSDMPPLSPGFTADKLGLHQLDGKASPIVRGKPPFPTCAKGPGEAVIEFFVEPDGTVGPLKVVSATSACFARAAERAALSWRYRPKVVDGQAVRSDRQRVRIIFTPD